MANQRILNERALGKHMGHACEGHLRGILGHLTGSSGARLVRQLPFDFPVHPDAVLLDQNGKVLAVFIVAFWANADNSHMKFYRTRTEYLEMVRAFQEYRAEFSDQFVLATVIYGSETGWKEQILLDLADQCHPLIFLPDALGIAAAHDVVTRAFSLYRQLWEEGNPNAREAVEAHFATNPLCDTDSEVLEIIQRTMAECGPWSPQTLNERSQSQAIVPDTPVRVRLRQALGLLSLFHPEEINAWLSNGPNLTNPLCKDFAIRAFFLDMGHFARLKSLVTTIYQFLLKQPVRLIGNNEVYAPDLPDFQDWMRFDPRRIESVSAIHREHTCNPSQVFRGGAYDQIAGNWRDICLRIVSTMPSILSALSTNNKAQFLEVILAEQPVTASDWHPARGMAFHHVCWAVLVSALAIAYDDRAVRSRFGARRQQPPTQDAAELLFEECRNNRHILQMLNETIVFAAGLLSEDLETISQLQRPLVFSQAEPCSWTADFYNTLTTNSSHNPLNEVVRVWLKNRCPDVDWHGWPIRRSRSLASIFGQGVGRRQWQFVGIDAEEQVIYAAEVKSITQNNWGNKSKELYDRVAETRAAARALGWTCHTILVIDGDLTEDALAELRTGIGHDEIVSIEDIW